jgi:lipopolysaccharide export LptBFGC system permease protein LptF
MPAGVAMPVIWRLILRDALKLWTIIVVGAVAFMVVVQMNEIARFAALSADPWLILRFIGLQLPYILPNACPLAGLLASYVTFRRLSVDGELTSLRAAGCPLRQLLAPLICFGVLVGLFTFGVASEIAPRCRSLGKELVDRVAASNPLAVIHQKRMMRLADSWVVAEPDGHEAATQFWMALPTGPDRRLALIHADRLALRHGQLDAEGLLMFLPHQSPTHRELWCEQVQHASMDALGLAPFLIRGSLQRAEDYLGFMGQWNLATAGCALAWHEILRRIALGIAPLVMIPLGAAYGMTTARFPRRIDILIPLLMAFVILGGFIAGKSLPQRPLAYLPLFIAPLVLSCILTRWRFCQLREGRVC